MAKSLGYKDKVTWETIQNPYVPDGMIRQWQEQAKSQQAYNTLLNTMVNIVPPLYNFSIKNVIQDFLMYNKFANKKIRKKVILYDKLIIQRKNYNW